MRMMNPSPGECWDRISILTLKMEHSDLEVFKVEHTLISTYLAEKGWLNPSEELIDEIGKINSRLWDLEDAQRDIAKKSKFENTVNPEDEYEFCQNARLVIQLNDARANTVQKINAACNVDAPEKLYK